MMAEMRSPRFRSLRQCATRGTGRQLGLRSCYVSSIISSVGAVSSGDFASYASFSGVPREHYVVCLLFLEGFQNLCKHGSTIPVGCGG